jgi:hypothetical protein
LTDVVQISVQYTNIDLDEWKATPQAEKDILRDVTRDVFAERSGVQPENVNVYFIIRNDKSNQGTRQFQERETIVINTGDLIVIIEIVIPPTSTSDRVKQKLESDLLEVDENIDIAIGSTFSNLDLGNAIITSTIVVTKQVIASPPPPRPDNISPFTDESLILIVSGSCVVLVLFIVLARECDTDMIRATRRLLLGCFDALTSANRAAMEAVGSKEMPTVARNKIGVSDPSKRHVV